MVYFVQEGRREWGQLPGLPWHTEPGTENLQGEGKSATSPQALLPKLSELGGCSLPSHGSLSPGMSPTQKQPAMQSGVSGWSGAQQAGSLSPKARGKPLRISGTSLR